MTVSNNPYSFKADGKSYTVEVTAGGLREIWKLFSLNLHRADVLHNVTNVEAELMLPMILAVFCKLDLVRLYPSLKDESEADRIELAVGYMDQALTKEEAFMAARKATLAAMADFFQMTGKTHFVSYLQGSETLLQRATSLDARSLQATATALEIRERKLREAMEAEVTAPPGEPTTPSASTNKSPAG